MVSQCQRMTSSRLRRKAPFSRDAVSAAGFTVRGSRLTPSKGVNSTATTHEISSAAAITTNSVKVYSPAALRLRPTGMKPITVTSVPVSIGKAVEV